MEIGFAQSTRRAKTIIEIVFCGSEDRKTV